MCGNDCYAGQDCVQSASGVSSCGDRPPVTGSKHICSLEQSMTRSRAWKSWCVNRFVSFDFLSLLLPLLPSSPGPAGNNILGQHELTYQFIGIVTTDIGGEDTRSEVLHIPHCLTTKTQGVARSVWCCPWCDGAHSFFVPHKHTGDRK